MEKIFEIDQSAHRLEVTALRPQLRFVVDGQAISLQDLPSVNGAFAFNIDGKRIEGWRHVSSDGIFIRFAGRTFSLRRRGVGSGAAMDDQSRTEIRAEMPGTVVNLRVAPGQGVEEGDTLLTIESMKLQMTIVAHRAGQIAAVHVAENSTFDRDALLVSFAAEDQKKAGA